MSQESVFTRLPHSQYCPRQSSPTVSAAGFDENPGSAPDMQEENGVVTPNTTKPVADAENTQTESSNITLPDSEPNNMKSWTLAQLRSELARVVVQKQAASGQERAILEIRRLALIDRVSITERTEEKKRDASRRVIIGVDVRAPPPDRVEKPWRKRYLGPNSRRSGPRDTPKEAKMNDEDEESNFEQELRSKRWKGKRKRELEKQAEEQAEVAGYLEDNAEVICEADAQLAKKPKHRAELLDSLKSF